VGEDDETAFRCTACGAEYRRAFTRARCVDCGAPVISVDGSSRARVEETVTEDEPEMIGQPAAGWWLASDGKWYPPNRVALYSVMLGVMALAFGVFASDEPLLGLAFGVLAVYYGMRGRDVARRGYRRHAAAIAGSVLGLGAMAVGVVSYVRSSPPTSSDVPVHLGEVPVTQTTCATNRQGYGMATGQVLNTGTTPKSILVTVLFLDANGDVLDQATSHKFLYVNAAGRYEIVSSHVVGAVDRCAIEISCDHQDPTGAGLDC